MMRPRTAPSLVTLLLPGVVLVVLLAAGAGIVASVLLGREAAERTAEEKLAARVADWALLQQQRYRQLELIGRSLAGDEILLGYLEESEAVRDTLEQYQNRLVFDFARIVDRDGRVVARTGGGGQTEVDPPPAADSEVTTGVLRDGDRAWHVVALPLVREYERLGRLSVGLAIDETALRRVRFPGVEVFLVDAGGARLAGTDGADELSQAVAAIAGSAALLEESARGAVASGESFRVRTVPLRAADGSEAARLALVADVRGPARPFRVVALAAAAGGGLALLLGGLGAWGVARRFEGPLIRFRRALEESSEGGLELPAAGGELGRIAAAVRTRIARTGAREELAERVRSRLALRPPPAGPLAAPRSERVCLLAVEPTELTEPRDAHDAEAVRDEVAAAVAILAEEVESRGGLWHGPAGGRLVAILPDDPVGALGLAGALGARLGARRAGDGGPRIVLVAGEVVTAGLRTARGEVPLAVGTLARRADAILREAPPGEIAFSDLEKRVLDPTLQSVGVSPGERRGILATRPFWSLSASEAARAAGVQPAGPADGATRRRLVAGSWFELRWEVLHDLGRGPWGGRLIAIDRETAQLVRIDLLERSLGEDPDVRDRLGGVARRIRDLRHPHVAPLLHAGPLEGRMAIVCPWVEGIDVGRLLEKGAGLAAGSALQLGRDLAGGLVALHERGLAHGAIGPAHAMVDVRGRACWTDPGLLPALRPAGREAALEDDLVAFGRLLGQLVVAAGSEPRLRAAAERAGAATPTPSAAEVAGILGTESS